MPPVTANTTPESVPLSSTMAIVAPGDNPDLRLVLAWLDKTALPHERSRLSYATIPVGIAIGFAGAYSGATLGASFGGTVAGWTNASSLGNGISQLYFGIVSYTPVAILISLPTQQTLAGYANQWQGEATLPTLDDRPKLRAFATCFTQFVSLFAGTPFFDLVHEQLLDYPVLNYLLPACAMISSYCAIISPSNVLKDNLLDRFESMTPAVTAARVNLLTQIDSALQGINTMSNPEIQAFFAELKNRDNTAFVRLQKLLDRQDCAPMTAATPVTQYDKRMMVRDFLGYSIGASISYVFYNLAVQTSNSFVTNAGLATFVGIVGTGVNAIFTAKWGQARAATLYTPNAGTANFRPTLRGSALQILACSGSAPGTYIAITTTAGAWGWVGGIVSFLGGGLAKYPGFDFLANTLVDFYENVRYADTADVQRKQCLKILTTLREQIHHLHPQQLLALSTALPNRPAAEQQPLSIRVEIPGVASEEKSPSRVVIHQSLFSPRAQAAHESKPATPPAERLQQMTP